MLNQSFNGAQYLKNFRKLYQRENFQKSKILSVLVVAGFADINETKRLSKKDILLSIILL